MKAVLLFIVALFFAPIMVYADDGPVYSLLDMRDSDVIVYAFPTGAVYAHRGQMLFLANGSFMPFTLHVWDGRALMPVDYIYTVFGSNAEIYKLYEIEHRSFAPVRKLAEFFDFSVGFDTELTRNPVVWVDYINEEWEVDLEGVRHKLREALEVLRETIEDESDEFITRTIEQIAGVIEDITLDRHIGRYAVIDLGMMLMLIDEEGNAFMREMISVQESVSRVDFESAFVFSRFFHS